MFRFSITIDDGPLDLDRIARSGQMFRWKESAGRWLVHDGSNKFSVTSSGSTLHVDGNQDEAAFRHLLRLDYRHCDQLEEIVRLGPELAPFVEDRKGLRLLRPASKTETLFSFLCSANNNVTRITSMVWKLAALGGDGFPDASEIAEVSEQTLREQGFGYRGATIPKVAQVLASNGGEKYLEELSRAGFETARAALIELPGVGKKLADCICLFAFDYGESVPIDTHIWQVLTRLYYPHWVGTNVTDIKYEEAAGSFRDRFGNLAGAAHQFLFVDNMERYREREKR